MAGSTDVCPAPGAPAGTSAALSVGYPAGSAVVGSSSAVVDALVASAAAPATYWVEYGSSPDYGGCTASVPVSAMSSQQAVQAVITGLAPETTYHFRVVATDGTDTALGADQTFVTLPVGEIPQGATINGVSVGGTAAADALRALREVPGARIRVAFDARHWSVTRTQLGARIEAGRAVAAALQALPGQALTAPITVDARRLTTYLAAANRRFGQAARPAVLHLDGEHAVVTRAQPGAEIDTARARSAIAAYLTQGHSGVLRLAVRRTAAPPARNQKAVVVRLSTQTLTAYLDGKPLLSTPVTTGRPALPTPVGSFNIHSRNSPYVFTSPWPKGNPFWYPPTAATWAMYFYDNDFLHDDPGEPASAFGAGSQDGPYASHGCVHVPRDAMAFLYQWLPVGATVIIARD